MMSKCIVWTGNLNFGGYGVIWSSKYKRAFMAHRVLWEGINGKIPEGLCIDHLCRNRACVNVNHLRVVTNKENVLCGVGVSAQYARQTHCHKGHLLFGDNLKPRKGKHERVCKTCQRNRNARYMKRTRQLAKELDQ